MFIRGTILIDNLSKGGIILSSELTPILIMWQKYPEELKKLLTDPPTAAVEELEKVIGGTFESLIPLQLATSLLSFIIKNPSDA